MITCNAQFILDLDEELSRCDHEWELVHIVDCTQYDCKKCGKTKTEEDDS